MTIRRTIISIITVFINEAYTKDIHWTLAIRNIEPTIPITFLPPFYFPPLIIVALLAPWRHFMQPCKYMKLLSVIHWSLKPLPFAYGIFAWFNCTEEIYIVSQYSLKNVDAIAHLMLGSLTHHGWSLVICYLWPLSGDFPKARYITVIPQPIHCGSLYGIISITVCDTYLHLYLDIWMTCVIVISYLGLVLLTLYWVKIWDNHSLVNDYHSFYPRIALVAPSPGVLFL